MQPIDRKQFIEYLEQSIPAILDAPEEVLEDKEAFSRIMGSVKTLESLLEVINDGAFAIQSESKEESI